jgi:hypothetical protein
MINKKKYLGRYNPVDKLNLIRRTICKISAGGGVPLMETFVA